MGNPYSAQLTDDNNRLRVDGSITFTDSGNQPGGSQTVLSAVVTLSAAQILALHTTPVELVATPGANKALHIASMFAKYAAGATPYTDAVVVNVFYDGGATNLFGLFIDGMGQATSQVMAENEGQGQPSPLTEAANKGLVVKNTTGTPITAGNGTLRVTTYYSVVDVT